VYFTCSILLKIHLELYAILVGVRPIVLRELFDIIFQADQH
jgi:hypothetical protein